MAWRKQKKGSKIGETIQSDYLRTETLENSLLNQELPLAALEYNCCKSPLTVELFLKKKEEKDF